MSSKLRHNYSRSFVCFCFGVEVAGEIGIFDKDMNRKLHEQFLSSSDHFIDLQKIFSENEDESCQIDGQQKCTQYNNKCPGPLRLIEKQLINQVFSYKR